ncbi:DUF3618 domain-containing protein [Microbacterium sp. Marseille-Q6965]|uniref:DUF3618 domain-containing protein n=1 Tax=Microbacterium sp. Marseille-Q6965 TaxID=2965072 RepID=UPI0021B80F2E|nr:DUF3618 domain-containing protein [Microbacterium sp. Marseille-Q6965]
MTDSPDAIRADIDRTRDELGRDVDALADKVNPSKAMHRQTDKVKGAFSSVRERIMGAADDAASSMHGAGSSVGSGVSDAAHRVSAKAEGNPLAVGLIAFGVGLLASSLIPSSSKEKELGARVKEQAQPLMEEAKGVAQEMGEHLKEPAQEAVTAVKETAQNAVTNVRDEAQGAAETVSDQAQQSRQNVTEG